MRSGSICRYRPPDRSVTLRVMVREPPRRGRLERLLRRGDPVPEIGESAALVRDTLLVVAGAWLLVLSIWRRDRQPVDRGRLVDGALRATNLLDQAAHTTGPAGTR